MKKTKKEKPSLAGCKGMRCNCCGRVVKFDESISQNLGWSGVFIASIDGLSDLKRLVAAKAKGDAGILVCRECMGKTGSVLVQISLKERKNE